MRKVFNSRGFKIAYRVLKIFLTIVIVSYLVLLLLQLVGSKTSFFGYYIFNNNDREMSTFYDKNDLILVKANPSKINLGDDVVYYGVSNGLEDRLIIHRVVNVNDNKITTQAIKSPIKDPEVDKNIVFGKVTSKLTVLSTMNHICKNKLAFFFIIVFPTILVFLVEILRTISNLKIEIEAKKLLDPDIIEKLKYD